jgi:hypothetical protein
MAVSPAVRRYYAERIFAATTRDLPPPNFRARDDAPAGRAVVEGCRGGGKNLLEVRVWTEGGRIADVRLSCGLCNPAMYAAADVVAEWARGGDVEGVLATDPLEGASLEPLWERLGGPGRPDDAREKFQYALLALQRALLDARGEVAPPLPRVPEPAGRDGIDDDDEA